MLYASRTEIFNWLFKPNFRRLHGALKAVHTNVDVYKQVTAYTSALGGAYRLYLSTDVGSLEMFS